MSEAFTPRKAVEFAVKTEELGARFYQKLAVKFADQADMHELFSVLANDEVAHEAQFRRLLEDTLPDEGESSGPEFDYLRAMSLSQFFMGEKGLKKKYKKIKDKSDALRIVFELEKATLHYYQALKDVLGESETLDAIIEAEKAHVMKAMQYVVTDARFKGL